MARKKTLIKSDLTEEELAQRLFLSLLTTVAIVTLSGISILFFGPKIGAFFGLLSSHRNDRPNIPTARPNPPLFTNLPEATNQEKLTVSGTSQPGYTVKLYVNGPEKASAIVGADGGFTFADIKLNTGRNSVFAKAVNQSNEESLNTEYYTIMLDTRKPKIDLETPQNDDTVRNLDKRVLVKGKIDEQVTLTINKNSVIIQEDGNFDYLLGVKEGLNEISIEATDKAGNKVEEKITIRYENRGI
ncbi:hypothetical protein A3K34_02580 [candidate division WWE3 bacterium RIFOXYC1_FULL_40_10]|uniref:Bacterial Ig-like domain-containing protein n=1 Tax=candidate division WWE3 bacterium RIFOXYA2_FULL_46_9 TaxID=1802636 RepID=A0A1F4W2S6_UNCKA|nr:MAG: hypothetical protein A3K58_02580 [candidate division WWE3 bacterium RIFOXYB1_FULL_40_22]OGC61733.1 MAG: hypothetical protein A3K37_02580 [candidate division WWE3 bacterium RIFOXYA1_FULL_40_11]OGC63717.1 MAG: hypothetical protein A2264_05070 [candidate division WWE3 bacterium RIFOXYA2_FULL_46_9]OGC65124.1 MAG: hypothetical protein A2326_01005 [candidate division WWE3 bacterium RIFOXYB2_FULL_41_6]OGC66116.1 MAG: hypothetical protein A3K34_02580 [candidate division WWE3 bacterium RIFOXYC1_